MNFQEFKKRWDKEGKEPLGSIKLFLIGVIEHVNGNKEGKKMIALTIPKNYLKTDGTPGRNAYLDQFEQKPRAAYSYLGGTPENDYKYSIDNDLVVGKQSKKSIGDILTKPFGKLLKSKGENSVKIFIESGGKDFDSPVKLRKNNEGYWKLFNVGSLATGVKKTPKEIGDF